MLIIIAVFIASVVFLASMYINKRIVSILPYFEKPNPYGNSIILFYKNDCDHCAKVDNFIRDNKIEDKVAFVKLDVSNLENANILSDKAQTCGLDVKIIGVPFLWDGKTCILGDVEVIDFFKTKIYPVK